jgi:uncharacterized membrane protein YedE/YeeE
MESISTPMLLALAGLGLGFVMGATARAGRFCTFGAVEDFVLARNTLRLKAWALAIAVAVICVQIMHHFGIARIDDVFYLGPRIGLASSIGGGLLFGLGMSMVGTCGYGIIVRLAGGDLKALFSFLVLGLTGYMTARGLTSFIKVYTLDSIAFDAGDIGGQGLPHFAGWLTGIAPAHLWLPIGLAVGGAMIVYCFKDPAFRRSRRDIAAGILIGCRGHVLRRHGRRYHQTRDPLGRIRRHAGDATSPPGGRGHGRRRCDGAWVHDRPGHFRCFDPGDFADVHTCLNFPWRGIRAALAANRQRQGGWADPVYQ